SQKIVRACAAIAVSVALWTACTGDDPSSTQTGAVGQPCNAGNTCNTTDLTCNGGFCKLVASSNDGGTTSSGSSSASSGQTSSSSSSGGASSSSSGAPAHDFTNNECSFTDDLGGPHCTGAANNRCSLTQRCCGSGDGTPACSGGACVGSPNWECENSMQCK